ncbi:sulfotransferase 1E1-like isoform X2 [Episyrphus balteatus]|uniref:sulfotransferase 1E1-like isoform X2 n=1 Tax=Episyrphus balteatus TaxID=286459 RepID=UPI002485594D|nr:sulfotransferase 1E1-like isoform X2 [Episyrphus balteatus]
MSKYFRCEPVKGTKLIKIFSKYNENLPIEFDCNQRFTILQTFHQEYLDEIQELEVRKDDIWVISQPKSGTTWMLELVWLLQNNCDFETALKVEQEVRVPFLEFCSYVPKERPNSFDEIAKMSSPRIIKSHLPIHLLPKGLWTVKPRIIFITRNPKDTIASFYPHCCTVTAFEGSKEDFVNAIIENKMRHSPFGVQTLEFWQLRNEPYIFFTSFERMKKDLRSVILGLSAFLGKNLDENQMVKLLDHLSFEKMKDNPMCNHISEIKQFKELYNPAKELNFRFVRKGAVGSHKTELSEDLIERIEKWYKKHVDRYGVTAEEIFFA